MRDNKIYIILLIIFLFLFLGSVVILSLIKKEQKKPVAPISPTVAAAKASLKLTTVGDQKRFPVNQPLTFKLLADSAGEEIVGFDVLVAYDPSVFDFVKAASLLPDFKVYSYKREGYVILTVIKSLQSQTATFFRETPVLTLDFTPKKTGRFSFSLKERIGKETTNLVNNKTKKINPKLLSIIVEIY